ncbi:alpha/beta fold hydrolase [Pseudonocardia sp. HH130630-07]|uniref:alpha/beta fold hydrolase n=1 Tax=Pseudonocardia sp. HH130630-07 TaxID=1690815 RepID=UPI0008151B32|nr:alpha/beta fold hydrolase [Pseudonocardia sp. HH130630-07]ANY10322.1 poly(3-hydroxyalkanoate) depolymerase [Pseudonocardia sp. HH130630-07]
MTPTPPPQPAGSALEEHDVLVGGRTLRVVRRPASGPGARRTPLLLCNGIGAATDVLDPLVAALPADLDVIRFDPPGIGASPSPRVPYHLTWLAHRLGQVLTKLDVYEADVLGFSWGGMLAQQLAISRRRRVRRLVLAATGPGALMIPASPRVLAVMTSPRRHQDPAYVDAVASRIYGGTLRDHPERAAEALGAGHRRGPMRGYYYQLMALSGWTSLPLLPMITADTLVIAGDDDPIVPRGNATLLHRGIRRSRVHRYPGGHLELLLNPQPFADTVDAFLRS